MNRKKIIRIILAALAVAALLASGGCALWKNGFFEKINSVEALREVIAGAGVWAGAVYFALQMMTVIIAPIPSNISMMAGGDRGVCDRVFGGAGAGAERGAAVSGQGRDGKIPADHRGKAGYVFVFDDALSVFPG